MQARRAAAGKKSNCRQEEQLQARRVTGISKPKEATPGYAFHAHHVTPSLINPHAVLEGSSTRTYTNWYTPEPHKASPRKSNTIPKTAPRARQAQPSKSSPSFLSRLSQAQQHVWSLAPPSPPRELTSREVAGEASWPPPAKIRTYVDRRGAWLCVAETFLVLHARRAHVRWPGHLPCREKFRAQRLLRMDRVVGRRRAGAAWGWSPVPRGACVCVSVSAVACVSRCAGRAERGAAR